MGLSSTDYALLMMIMALGTYFQTVTGFGLAMIVIGLSSGLGLGNIPLLATVVSIITLANSAIALRHHHHHIQWRIFWVVLAAVLPASIIGVMLLDFLNHQAKNLLALLLGLLIIYSGVIFSLKPQKKPSLDGSPRFFGFGFFAGLCGGLFGMPGPPIIFQMYQQPLPLIAIRSMLLLIFAMTALIRTLYEAAASGLPHGTWLLTALSFPCVALATLGAQRFPPPVSAARMRIIVFGSLILIGLSLVMQSLPLLFTALR